MTLNQVIVVNEEVGLTLPHKAGDGRCLEY